MKRRNIILKKILVVFLVCVLIISISSTQKTKDKNVKNNINPKNINETINNQPPKVSKCWFLDGPISINDALHGVGAQNWTWARNQDWCRKGDGSAGNPYVIENVTIDGHSSSFCLVIENSYKYFKINNCTFINSAGGALEAGLWMPSVENGTIVNSHFESNLGSGIRISNGNNITIRDSFITNNTENGIYLDGWCQYINIIGNTIKNNTLGVNLTNYAMNNLIYRNKFISNLNHAYDNGSFSPNQWNSTTIGNYWDNYTGKDVNDDGIGDTPQKIPGTAGKYDYFPIWSDGILSGDDDDDDDDDDNEKSSNTLDKVLSFIKTPIGIGIVAGTIIALLAIIIIIKKRSR